MQDENNKENKTEMLTCCGRFRLELARGTIQSANNRAYLVHSNPFVKPVELEACPYCNKPIK